LHGKGTRRSLTKDRGRASLPDRLVMFRIPSGKLTKSYGKSPSLMGKSTN